MTIRWIAMTLGVLGLAVYVSSASAQYEPPHPHLEPPQMPTTAGSGVDTRNLDPLRHDIERAKEPPQSARPEPEPAQPAASPVRQDSEPAKSD